SAEAGVVAGAKVGAGFGQPFGPLGSSFVPEFELGYVLPVLDGDLRPFLAAGYSAPRTQEQVEADARLPGDGVMSYDIVQQQLMLTLGARYHLKLGPDILSPYAALGARLYLMRSLVSAEAGGEPFGDNEETETRAGVYAAAGTELALGPGALLAELGMGWAKIDGYVLRDTSAGALNLSIGYRMRF
ncbi:MAG: hypothetical protein ACOC0J_00055, partial [Myxococcota bacterium]